MGFLKTHWSVLQFLTVLQNALLRDDKRNPTFDGSFTMFVMFSGTDRRVGSQDEISQEELHTGNRAQCKRRGLT